MLPDDVSSQEPGFARNWHTKDGKVIQRKSGQAYNGEMPYVVLAIVGHKIDELRDLSPTAAINACAQAAATSAAYSCQMSFL